MGLLDDAIREHLELKRRHGAGEDEVRRQEQEALGPPRRGEVPQPLAPPGEEELEAEPTTPATEETGLAPAAPVEPEVVAEPAEVVAEPAEDLEPVDEPEDEVWLEAPEEQPPAAYAAGDTVPEEAAADDVLEETPEFLQETPEHDRLWFEQKPPKDFDFDK